MKDVPRLEFAVLFRPKSDVPISNMPNKVRII